MGGFAAHRLQDMKRAAINALHLEEKAKEELARMDMGFLFMHCVAAAAASRW